MFQLMNDFINNVPTYNYCVNHSKQQGNCYFYIFEHYNPGLFFGFNLFMPFTGKPHLRAFWGEKIFSSVYKITTTTLLLETTKLRVL